MSASTASPAPSAGGMSRREGVGRTIIWLAVLAAAGSTVTALFSVLDADGATKVIETWRLCGLAVFTGLFALLSLHPHHYRGVWELVIASKLALTVAAVGYAASGGVTGAGTIIGWDGGLTIALIAAYICCRGWTASPRLLSKEPAAWHDDHPGRSAHPPNAGSPGPVGPSSGARHGWDIPARDRQPRGQGDLANQVVPAEFTSET